MIDRKWIGHELFDATFAIERGRLRFFAEAIGETDPIYVDEAAARAAGHPDLPAPPTFLFAAELDHGVLGWFERAGVPLGKVLHGEERFDYHRVVHAGDVVRVVCRVADLQEKKGGALELVVFSSRITDASRGDLVAELTGTMVVRHR